MKLNDDQQPTEQQADQPELSTVFHGHTIATFRPGVGVVVEDQLMTLPQAEAMLAGMSLDDRLASAIMPIEIKLSNAVIREWLACRLEAKDGGTDETTIQKLVALIRSSN